MKNKIQQLVRKNIIDLAPYASARKDYSSREGIFLDANESPFGIHNRYPDPYQLLLKQKLAELKGIDLNQIFLGNGSDEIIDLTLRIFCEPYQDKALIFTPTYGMYQVSASINAVELINLPLNDEFQINIKALMPYLSLATLKLIFICSPNNPTGNLLKEEDIEFILNHFKGIVYLDEAYIDFCKQPSFAKKLNRYPNLIVSQTLSKAWGLAGARIGVGYMNQEILAYFNKVKAPYNIGSVGYNVAIDAIGKKSEFDQRIIQILNEKEKVINALRELTLIRKIYPSDANFLLVEVESANALYNKLLEQKIITRNRHSDVANCLRITIGNPEENEKLINTLKILSNA